MNFMSVFVLCLTTWTSRVMVEATNFDTANFRLSSFPCFTNISTYQATRPRSKVKCSDVCLNNRYGVCGRFIWDSNTKECMLHSQNITSGFHEERVWQIGWMMYNLIKNGCDKTGYDYIMEAHICIKMYKDTRRTWVEAKAICESDGGALISVATNQTRDAVHNYAKCYSYVWIGLQHERWLNGTPFVNIFGDKTRLNEYDSQFPSDVNATCGTLSMRTSEVWVLDDSCNMRKRRYFVCEISL